MCRRKEMVREKKRICDKNFFAKTQLVKGSLIRQRKGVIISVTHGFGTEVSECDSPADFVSYTQAETGA